MIVEGKHIYLYGEKEVDAPLVIVNTFEGTGNDVYMALEEIINLPVCLAVISDINWDDEMSPWESEALSKHDSPCTGGADKYLQSLTKDIIPAIKNELGYEPKQTIIAGYSLAGLFAIYSLYNTDLFTSAVSASGSMWFPDFVDFTKKNVFRKTPKKVYFSLGDKEAKTRHPLLSTVENKTLELFEDFKNRGIETIFESNPGNHFRDASLRLAKGIAWVLQ